MDTDLEEGQDRIEAGRGEYSWTKYPDWVMLAPIPDRSKVIYGILRMHLHQVTGESGPGQATLAQMIGVKRTETVAEAIQPLVGLGAVDVRTERYGKDKMRQRNVYTIHLTPPLTHAGPTTKGEWYKARDAGTLPPWPEPKKKRRKTAGHAEPGPDQGPAEQQTSTTSTDASAGTATDPPENRAPEPGQDRVPDPPENREELDLGASLEALPLPGVVRNARTRSAGPPEPPRARGQRSMGPHTPSPVELNATAHSPGAWGIVSRWRATHTPQHRMKLYREMTKQVDKLLADRAQPELIEVALRDWDSRGRTVPFLENCYDDALRATRPLHLREVRDTRPSTADAAVAKVGEVFSDLFAPDGSPRFEQLAIGGDVR